MIIIKSLVPGGVAELDGRLEVGDRLIAVNAINLFNASLDETVHALKGAPRGVVTLRVLKPERFGESSTDYDQVDKPSTVGSQAFLVVIAKISNTLRDNVVSASSV